MPIKSTVRLIFLSFLLNDVHVLGLGTPNLGKILQAIEEIDVRREQRHKTRV